MVNFKEVIKHNAHSPFSEILCLYAYAFRSCTINSVNAYIFSIIMTFAYQILSYCSCHCFIFI